MSSEKSSLPLARLPSPTGGRGTHRWESKTSCQRTCTTRLASSAQTTAPHTSNFVVLPPLMPKDFTRHSLQRSDAMGV